MSGFLVRGLNAWVLDKVSHGMRVFINGLLMLLGLIGVALAPNFPLAVAAIVIVGSASSMGESVILGYLQNFAPNLVGGWSSGTGTTFPPTNVGSVIRSMTAHSHRAVNE